ncbi:hypothetical protein [Microbacterium sp.]|uniref:hypothetical protein n=1 Tax=Microbacterium sp. TaxID=51671 RepID=UPI0039E6FC22
MPHVYNPPLPSVPRSGSHVQRFTFIVTHSPEEFVALLSELEQGPARKYIPDLLETLREIAFFGYQDHSMAILELMLKHENNHVRAHVADFIEVVAGAGIERFEQIIWEELLFDSDDLVFRTTYESLVDAWEINAERKFPYSYPELLLAGIKLGRARPRYLAICAAARS